MRRKGYPSGKSYGKSDEILKTVKAACESCHARKQKQKKKTQHSKKARGWNDSGDDGADDDDDDDEDSDAEDASQQVKARLNSQWSAILQSLDARIVELEGRNRDLIERKEDRDRREQRKQWRSDLQIEVLSTYRHETAATNS